MSKKYPKVHLQALLYPTDTPGMHINWNYDFNPFFPEGKHLEEELPHWKVLRPLMRKMKKHMRGGDGTRAMIRLAQQLILQDDFEETTVRLIKEYPRKYIAVLKACFRAVCAFPFNSFEYDVNALRLSFWDDINGLEDANRFYREIPERKAYLKALAYLLMAEAGEYEYAPKRIRELLSDAFWDHFLELEDIKILVEHHFARAKARSFTPANWSIEDVVADMALWESIRSEWREIYFATLKENFERHHPNLSANEESN